MRKPSFRARSRDKLQGEYVGYREAHLRGIAAAEASTPDKFKCAPVAQAPEPEPEPQSRRECVLFARHVPPDMYKTALRTRFSASLADPGSLDHVDYTQGLDSVRPLCFIFVDLLLAMSFAPDDA